VLLRCFKILRKEDRIKLAVISLIQTFLGFLDLIGVAAIGALGALAISGLESKNPGNRVNSFLSILHLNNLSFQTQATSLAVFAVIVLVGRTFLSIFFSRKSLFFLGRRGAQISSSLISRLLSQSLLKVRSRSSQEVLFSTTRGVEVISLGILGTLTTIVSDTSALIFIILGLLVIDPVIGISTITAFSVVGFSLYRMMHVKANKLGRLQSTLSIQGNKKILEVLGTYREAVIHGRRDYYAREIGELRFELADTLAELNFMPNVGKYVIETTVLFGGLLVGGFQFLAQDSTHAVATLSVFLAAGTRVAPAVLRIQQATLLVRSNLGQASPTLDMLDELGELTELKQSDESLERTYPGFTPTIQISDLSFTYPGNESRVISKASLQIDKGKLVAFVGPSGSGKTTFIDLILGILEPDSGFVQISGLSPLEAIKKWPGAISYVSQEVLLIEGTIRENVALGYPVERATDEVVWEVLKMANLDEFVRQLPAGLENQIGENGLRLSGGQRQRLGIARALFTSPKLLVLDEATSALDGQTEISVTDSLQRLRGSVTLIVIAHRLSTVRSADKIVYLDGSSSLFKEGTFDEVRTFVPEFDEQAKIMGL